MSTFVARQPIFDRNKRVFAYELLSRSSPDNWFQGTDGDRASSKVISDSLNVFGLSALTGGKRAFINVTRKLLIQDSVTLLPQDHTVLEILETVEPDEEVVAACRTLKKAGYVFALDDFVYRTEIEPLLAVADIVKIDFLQTKGAERKRLVELSPKRGIHLLAEKVETHEDFQDALHLGYRYFQGYFFCRPEVLERREIPGYKLNYLRLLREVNRPDLDFGRLEAVIKQDLSLSMKLLRYINSVALGFRSRVSSIKHALVLLGRAPLRKWASVAAFMDMGDDRPTELMVTSLVRARLCEQMGLLVRREEQELDLFLMGMLSSIDALLGCSIDEAIRDLPITADVRHALLRKSGPLSEVLELALAYERGKWEKVTALSAQLGITEEQVAEIYRKSVEWADVIFTV